MGWIKDRKKLSRRNRVLARLSPAERRRVAHARLRIAAARLEVRHLVHRRPFAFMAAAFGAGVAVCFFPRLGSGLMRGIIAVARLGCGCASSTIEKNK